MKNWVAAAVDDLFFASKIRAAAEALGVTIKFLRDAEALRADEDAPALIIADLQAQRIDPFALAVRLKADASLRAVPLIGFYPHVQAELRSRAEAAGFDRVLPRSAFAQHLTQILLDAQKPSRNEGD